MKALPNELNRSGSAYDMHAGMYVICHKAYEDTSIRRLYIATLI